MPVQSSCSRFVTGICFVLVLLMGRTLEQKVGPEDESDVDWTGDLRPLLWSHYIRPDFNKASDPMLNYLIMKGCRYVSGFIKSTYTNRYQHPDDYIYWEQLHGNGKTCDIQSMVEMLCKSYRVPMELCCAALDCGVVFSAVAFNAPQPVMQRCNLSHNASILMAGNRRSVSYEEYGEPEQATVADHGEYSQPMGGMCATDTESVDTDGFGKRSNEPSRTMKNLLTAVVKRGVFNSYSLYKGKYVENPDIDVDVTIPAASNRNLMPSDITTTTSSYDSNVTLEDKHQFLNPTSAPGPYIVYSAGSNTSSAIFRPFQTLLRIKMNRWCKSFSRDVNHLYHFSQVPYVAQSQYWVVDTYRTAFIHRLPHHYAHSLVGCGIDYVMAAFNVSRWQTALYSLVT